MPDLDALKDRAAKVNKVSCHKCTLSELCLPQGLNFDELDKLESIIKPGRLLQRGERLYAAGQAFHSLFAVRSGSFRTFISTESGEQQVIAFYLPGELFGLDGMGESYYGCSAEAVEMSSVCELPFEHFDRYCATLPGFRRQFIRFVGQQISGDQNMLLLGKLNADARLASFLLTVAARLQRRGYAAREFNLTMPRHDIANYLGLAVETLSRLFRRFQESGLLSVQGRNIKILDRARLSELAQGCQQFQNLCSSA